MISIYTTNDENEMIFICSIEDKTGFSMQINDHFDYNGTHYLITDKRWQFKTGKPLIFVRKD